MSSTVPTIAPTQPPAPSTVSVPESAHPVSEMIDATETLYRLTAAEYEQIAGFLDDDRVELIDGFLVKKMGKNPPHVVVCARLVAALAQFAAVGWYTRPGEPVRVGRRTEPEPDAALARGTFEDYANRHPEPADVALVAEVADTTLAKDRRRKRTYGPVGIPVYWIVNINSGQIEVYTNPTPDGYASRVDRGRGEHVEVVIDGKVIGRIAVDDIVR
jgi:Uma2 family endonuclease